jgi:hypothetical protein
MSNISYKTNVSRILGHFQKTASVFTRLPFNPSVERANRRDSRAQERVRPLEKIRPREGRSSKGQARAGFERGGRAEHEGFHKGLIQFYGTTTRVVDKPTPLTGQPSTSSGANALPSGAQWVSAHRTR